MRFADAGVAATGLVAVYQTTALMWTEQLFQCSCVVCAADVC